MLELIDTPATAKSLFRHHLFFLGPPCFYGSITSSLWEVFLFRPHLPFLLGDKDPHSDPFFTMRETEAWLTPTNCAISLCVFLQCWYNVKISVRFFIEISMMWLTERVACHPIKNSQWMVQLRVNLIYIIQLIDCTCPVFRKQDLKKSELECSPEGFTEFQNGLKTFGGHITAGIGKPLACALDSINSHKGVHCVIMNACLYGCVIFSLHVYSLNCTRNYSSNFCDSSCTQASHIDSQTC